MRRTIKRELLPLLMSILLVLMTITGLRVSAAASNGTSLSDWSYNDTRIPNTIILKTYKGTSPDIVVPGSFTEAPGKKVMLYSLNGASSEATMTIFSDCTSINIWNIKSLKIGDSTHKVGLEIGNMTGAFCQLMNLESLDLSGLDTSNVTSMKRAFANTHLQSLDISYLDTSKVTDMSEMFRSVTSLKELKINGIDTSQVTDMSYMFNSCGFETLDISGFNTSNVTNMSHMFEYNAGVGNSMLKGLDLRNFDTGKVTDMSYMFKDCRSLTSLDVSNFNTSKVKNMYCMFRNCLALTSLDVSNFDTSEVTNMSAMFRNAQKLTSLDLSNFNTSKVENMSSMFQSCNNLHYFDLSGWDMSKVTNFSDMFTTSTTISNLQTVIECSDTNETKLKEICETASANRVAPQYPKYDTNGGAYADSSTSKQFFDSIVINESNLAALTQKKVCERYTAPTKTDDVFNGWYLDAACTTPYESNETTVDLETAINDNLTLYAGWRDGNHTVSYQFVSGIAGKDLPAEVTGLLPTETTVADGNKVTPTAPAQTTVSVTGGSWNFDGYDVAEKTATEDITFTGTWTYNSTPILTVTDQTITAGDAFDPMEGVSATDEEDGDLTGSVQIISNNVNLNEEGTYQITYQVTDSGGMTVTKTIHITVNKKDEPVTPGPSEDDNKPTTPDDNDKPDPSEEDKGPTAPGNNDKPNLSEDNKKPNSSKEENKPNITIDKDKINNGQVSTVNQGTSEKSRVETGDSTNVLVWLGLLAISGGYTLVKIYKKEIEL